MSSIFHTLSVQINCLQNLIMILFQYKKKHLEYCLTIYLTFVSMNWYFFTNDGYFTMQ